jgi:hypothetical protein
MITGAVLIYAVLVGVYASTPYDFMLCVPPLFALMYFATKPRAVDAFVFAPRDADIAEAFVEHIVDNDPLYDRGRVLIVNTEALLDELDIEA